MKALFFFILVFLSATMASQSLEKHLWKNRLLLIFTAEKNSKELKNQIDILSKNKEGLLERKLKIYQFSENQFTTDFNTVWFSSKKIQKRYQKKENLFEVVLVGLDGGVKYRQTKPISLKKLFALIDGMPMRKRELKN